MEQTDLYRVVAVRSDGTRVVLVAHLTKDRGQAVVAALTNVSAFAELRLEPESNLKD